MSKSNCLQQHDKNKKLVFGHKMLAKSRCLSGKSLKANILHMQELDKHTKRPGVAPTLHVLSVPDPVTHPELRVLI